jgi:hypothetical protein
MEHTQSRENREGNSFSRDSYRYDNDQSQKVRWHDGGGNFRFHFLFYINSFTLVELAKCVPELKCMLSYYI